VRSAREALGRLTILVNNVGGLGGGEVVHGAMDRPEGVFRRQLDVSLTGVLLISQAAAPLRTDGGAIINMSSIMAYKPAEAAWVHRLQGGHEQLTLMWLRNWRPGSASTG
jgi:NAD(P)-dependent dehydrogenase (short-subunit alcohol dehydrogenase family)